MANKQSVNWLTAQRVDIPDLRAIESGVIFDFKTLIKAFSGDTPYILSGFTIPISGISGPASALQLVVDGAKVWIPGDGNGSFLQVPDGQANEVMSSSNAKVVGSFSPGTNYISLRFKRAADPATSDLVSVWDVDAATEFTITAPRGLVLDYEIVIDGSSFGNNAPVAKVQVSGSNVTSIENAHQNLFRLGTGGDNPDPTYSFTFPNGPENSLTATSNSDPDPFIGGDFDIKNFKMWMDAVMTMFKNVSGSVIWYLAGTGGGGAPSDMSLLHTWIDSVGSLISGKGKFIHDPTTPGQLTWTSDIYIKAILGNMVFTVDTTNSPMVLADTEVAYIQLVRDNDFQAANTFTFVNGSATVSAAITVTNLVAGDWIKYFSHSQLVWAQVQSVVGSTVTLEAPYEGASAVGKAFKSTGTYAMQQALPADLPDNANVYWMAKRDDNSPITSVSVTAATRASNVSTFTTASPHGFVEGQTIVITGMTPTSFNGTFDIIEIVNSTQFRINNSGPNASASGFGTAAHAATIYLRALGELFQGEERQYNDQTTLNILNYIGSPSETVDQPTYTGADGTSVPVKYVADGDNLTEAAKTLDRSIYNNAHNKIVGGGTVAWALGSTQLTFTASMFVEKAGLAYSDNTITTAQSPITLPTSTSAAYVVPNLVTGGGNLTVTVAALTAVPTNAVIIARRDGNDVIVGTSSMRLRDGESKLLYKGTTNQQDDIERGDKTGFFRSDDFVTWTGTQIEFLADIVLEMNNTAGTTQQYSVAVAGSPIALSNGEYAYITVNRNLNSQVVTMSVASSLPAQPAAGFDIIPFAKRIDAGGAAYLHLPFHKQLLSEGQSVHLGASGSGSGSIKATYLNPISTTLPTGVSVVIDGSAGVNGDLVLFTKLASNNNRIYKLGGVGTSITWTPQRSFNGQFSPADGDAVRITAGAAFQEQFAVFNGTNFLVNDVIRQFDGVSGDFFEQSSIKTLTLANNTTDDVFTVSFSGSENMIMDYSVIRAGIKKAGSLFITTNGTVAQVAESVAYTGDPGVTFSALISGSDLVLNYTTTNTGPTATLKYSVKRWSDITGGPTGIPNYNTTPPSGVVPAAGNLNEVQYNGPGGLLAAESRFMWDPTLGALNLNGMRLGALSPAIPLADNQIAPSTIATFPVATFNYIEVRYSIVRGATQAFGTMNIITDGTTITFADGSRMETLPVGITFNAVIVGSNVEVQFTSTSTGTAGTLKYSYKGWV